MSCLQSGVISKYRVFPKTKMAKVFRAHAARSGSQVTSLRFVIDGELVKGGRTCAEIAEIYGVDYDMKELAEMDCFREMIGGGPAFITARPTELGKPGRACFRVYDFEEMPVHLADFSITTNSIIGKLFSRALKLLEQTFGNVDSDYLHFFIKSQENQEWRRLRYNFTYNQLVERGDVADGDEYVSIYYMMGHHEDVKRYLDWLVHFGEKVENDPLLSHVKYEE